MSLAKKCDICGKYHNLYNVYSARNKDVNNMSLCSFDKDNFRYYRNGSYDLCPECLLALKDFIESRGGACEIEINI